MGDKQIKGNRNGTFSSSLGFVIACVGSAVGLGNIWMFPYRVGQYGGAAFLIPYLLFTFLFGWVGLSGEFAIGRLARTGTIGSYEYCFARRGRKKLGAALSWIPLLGSLGIAIGYAVILGWVLRSLAGSVTGELLTADVEAFFSPGFGQLRKRALACGDRCAGGPCADVRRNEGDRKGEQGAYAAVFWAVPDLGGVGRIPAWRGRGLQIPLCSGMEGAAAGGYLGDGDGASVFLSLNHRLRHDRLRGVFGERGGYPAGLPAHGIVRHTCGAAFRPCDYAAVFAYGVDVTRGPSLMFIALPTVFQRMPFGRAFAVFFFISVAFAGITSLINMFEAVTESWQSHFGLGRKTAVLICSAITLAAGLFLEAEPRVGSWLDFITIVVVPIGAVLGAVSIYYVLGWDNIRRELDAGRKKPVSRAFGQTAKLVYVPLTVLILILGFIYKGIG